MVKYSMAKNPCNPRNFPDYRKGNESGYLAALGCGSYSHPGILISEFGVIGRRGKKP